MTDIQHLIVYQPGTERVPVSVFLVVDDPAGTVHGLYFGHAGSGTWDEAYFRMEVSAAGVDRFLECDSAEDAAFRVDRVRGRRRHLPPLSPADAAVFAALCSHRQGWWRFEDGDGVAMDTARVAAMQPVDDMLVARSAGLVEETLDRVRQYWSLRGF
jgi:hypothetical protein